MSQTLFVPHQTGRHEQNAVFMQSMLDLNFDDLSPSLFVQLHSGSDHDKDTFLLQSSRVGVYCVFLIFILKKNTLLIITQYFILKVIVHFYSQGKFEK